MKDASRSVAMVEQSPVGDGLRGPVLGDVSVAGLDWGARYYLDYCRFSIFFYTMMRLTVSR